jgi:hypothetical protein
VELCYSTGCPYVICVGRHDLSTLSLEVKIAFVAVLWSSTTIPHPLWRMCFQNGQIFQVTHNVGDEENPIVGAALSPRLQFSVNMRSSGRKLSSRGSTRSATVMPVDDDLIEEAKPIEVVTTDGTDVPAGVPALDLTSLPQSPPLPRGTSKTIMVACVLRNGDVFVVNAEVRGDYLADGLDCGRMCDSLTLPGCF